VGERSAFAEAFYTGDVMNIRTRLLLLLVPAIFLVLTATALLTYLSANKQAEALADMHARRISSEQSTLIFDKLRQGEAVVKSLAQSALEMRNEGNPDRRALTYVTKGVAASSRDFFGVWSLWQPDAFDGRDAEFIGNEDFGNREGRANSYWLRRPNGTLGYDLSDDYDEEPYYTQPQTAGRVTIIPPYRDMDTEDKTLMSTIAVPILDKGRFLGAVGVDIEMDFIKGLLDKVRPYESGYARLISDTGDIVADPLQKELPLPADILTQIRSGKAFTDSGTSEADGTSSVLCYYTPVKLESFDAPWYFMVALPKDKIMAESNRNLRVQLGISLLALAMLVALVFYTANSVSRPLQRIVAYADEVAAGKYDGTPDRKGFAAELQELCNALNSMVNALLGVMRQVEESSAETARGAEQARMAMEDAEQARQKIESSHKAMLAVAGRVDAVSQKVRETSQALTGKIAAAGREAREQSRFMDGAVSAVAVMSESIARVSSNAEDAATFAERTKTRATEGAGTVDRTLAAVDGIRREIGTLGDQIAVLSRNTESVGAILGLINDIADQTNLLALNAAIEAARAGDAGRGFAVVADEVRKLAEKTVQATQQVHESIKNIRSSMQVSAEGVERTAGTVHDTVELGHSAHEVLRDIVGLMQGMNEQVRGIAGLCREQATTGEQVSSAVQRLRELGESVSAAMDEGAEISHALVPEARELGLLVEELTAV
jgi:methyl-accepting chemotaxis protein